MGSKKCRLIHIKFLVSRHRSAMLYGSSIAQVTQFLFLGEERVSRLNISHD
jgi:hypothetical protein